MMGSLQNLHMMFQVCCVQYNHCQYIMWRILAVRLSRLQVLDQISLRDAANMMNVSNWASMTQCLPSTIATLQQKLCPYDFS